jgi:type VI secretion system secreted protein VgrG
MATSKQTDRLMQFSSTLGKDVLLIESLDGAEGISRLFEYHAELLAATGTAIDLKSIVGSKVAVAIALSDVKGFRWINGIVASFEQCAGDEDFDVYRARIVPSMWQMTLSSNCRVFQSKTVLEIVKAVIGDYGLSLSDQTSGSYKPLEYCTQYSESDFHFVSRLLEESGIFYWFEHTDQDNKIVLGDGRSAYQDCPLSASVPYALNVKGREGAYGSRVTEFTATSTMVSGKHSTADYNFRTYARVDVPDKSSSSDFGKNAYDEYLYPVGEEGYLKDSDTQSTTAFETLFLDTRELAADALAEVYRGTGNLRSFCAGYTFTLTANPRGAFNRKYLLTAVTHHADQVPSYRTSGGADGTEYSNRFTAVSSDIVFKPAQTCIKPKIYGPQTAFVVVPAGEDMYIDKFGRVCIQFFWDKLRPANKVDNTWVRVAQHWAGNGWGTYFWPRVKDEVVVQFLNGDPDNPVITGSVYNGVNMPKYPLPDNSTRSGIVTRSSKGGSGQNANELRFEDKMGSEQIYIHAEKDMDVSIEHDRRISVGNNDSLIVTTNQTEQVGGNYNREVKGNSVDKIDGKSDLNIGSDLTESVGGSHSLNVSSNQSVQVGSAYSMDANQTVYINGGMSVVIQAGMELSLIASGNFITIGPSGVAISGTMVLINSGGAAGSGSAGTVNSPASPAAPDQAEGASAGAAGSSPASAAGATPSVPSGAGAASLASGVSSGLGSALAGAAGAAAGLAGQAQQAGQQAQQALGQVTQQAQRALQQAQQAAQQAANQAQQLAQQAANQAQQAAQQAQQAANQAVSQAQQAVNQVTQQAQQAYQQASQAVQQAQQAVNQATAQGRAAAQQALGQAQQQLQQCAQAGQQAVQQAQQAAQQVQQQAQQVASQAQQAAQQAQQQAQQAAQQAQQAAQQAVQQAQQTAQQAQQQAQQAAQQAQQAAQQAVQQGQQAAQQATQQAQQAAQQAQQTAQQAQQQAQQAAQQAQQAAQQAVQQGQQAAQQAATQAQQAAGQAQQQAQQAGQQVQQAASQAGQQAQQASQAAQQSAGQAISQAQRGF